MKTRKHSLLPILARLGLVLVLLTVALGVTPVPVAHADTHTVTNTNDTGAGSLRQAIADASDGDTIEFDLTYPATITLTSGELTINDDLTISGPGASNLSISGNNSSRVFNISGWDVTISGLTITDGQEEEDNGGGLYNGWGIVTLTNVTFSDNTAYRGGGMCIMNEGDFSVALTNVTFSGNGAEEGGGLYSSLLGNLTLTNVTFSGNEAENGGGMYNGWGIVTLTNVTFSDNSAYDSGGGMYNGGTTVNLKNTLVAGNSASTGPDCQGTVNSQGYNLIQDTSDCTISGDTTGNIYGQDPLLSPLADNGGDTQTHALLPGSPAIDQIPSDINGCGSTITQDQRGEPRPVNYSGTGCDIGAFELQSDETASSTLQTEVEHSFGATLVKMTLNSGDPGTVSVTKNNQPAGGGSPDENEMPITWNITASGSTYNLDLILCYTDWELDQGNNVTEVDLNMYRWSGSTWVDQDTVTVDEVNHCVTKTGVTELSNWTLGDGPPNGGPTAVTLSSFTAKSSAGLGASLAWPWLVGVAMLVMGGVIWVKRRLNTRGNSSRTRIQHDTSP